MGKIKRIKPDSKAVVIPELSGNLLPDEKTKPVRKDEVKRPKQ